MNELNQLLLNFGSNKNFDKNDYFVSSSNYFAYNLIKNCSNLLIFSYSLESIERRTERLSEILISFNNFHLSSYSFLVVAIK